MPHLGIGQGGLFKDLQGLLLGSLRLVIDNELYNGGTVPTDEVISSGTSSGSVVLLFGTTTVAKILHHCFGCG